MAKTHYETLGVPARCTQDEIRTAYRKIVLQHHPDRSNTEQSHAIFIAATEAYEVLSDASRRRQYDELLRMDRLRKEQDRYKTSPYSNGSGRSQTNPAKPSHFGSTRTASQRQQESSGEPTVPKGTGIPSSANYKASTGSVATTLEVTRLTMLFNRGQLLESEKLARQILQTDPRQPIPYAVLGDLYKQRGDLVRAAEKYAIASQMDPGNDIYRLRHEELLTAIYPSSSSQVVEPGKTPMGPVLIASMVVLIGTGYLGISHEQPVMPGVFLVSQWTLGLIAMLVASGVAIGAGLSAGKLLDRHSLISKSATSGVSFNQVLQAISIIFFWAGAILYSVRGMAQDGFNKSYSRIYSAVSATVLLDCLAIAATGNGSVLQTLLWGGNLTYASALVGWIVADNLRHS